MLEKMDDRQQGNVELVSDGSNKSDESDDDVDQHEQDNLVGGSNKNNSETPQVLNGLVGGGGDVDISRDIDTSSDYTVDEAISYIGTGCFQYKLILITGILWATDAMEMMIITLLQPIAEEIWNLDKWSNGIIAMCVYGGMLFGTFILGTMSDRIGRRKIVIISIIGYSVFSLISSFSVNLYMLLILRFIVGFFIGGNAVAFTLFAEFSPTAKRGRMLVVQQAFWCFGALFSSFLGFVTLNYLNWRYYLMLSSIPLWTISLFSGWIPESPHYLMACGKYEETRDLLHRVSRMNNSALPSSGYLRTNLILNNHQKRGRLKDVFIKKYRFSSILLYTMLISSVFSYFGLSFIAQRIFISIQGNEYEEMLISTVSEIPALLIGIVVIDRIGRKTALSTCFMIYTGTCLLLCFEAIRSVPQFGVTLIFIGRMFTSLAFMTQFIYFTEFYPTAIRATALGGASSLDELSKIAADYLAQDITNISQGMIIFGVVGIISLICSFSLPIETLGRQLPNEIDYGSRADLKQRATMRVSMDTKIINK